MVGVVAGVVFIGLFALWVVLPSSLIGNTDHASPLIHKERRTHHK